MPEDRMSNASVRVLVLGCAWHFHEGFSRSSRAEKEQSNISKLEREKHIQVWSNIMAYTVSISRFKKCLKHYILHPMPFKMQH